MSDTKEPIDVINALSKSDKALVGKIMALEKRYLYLPTLGPQSREEKAIVAGIVSLVDGEPTE